MRPIARSLSPLLLFYLFTLQATTPPYDQARLMTLAAAQETATFQQTKQGVTLYITQRYCSPGIQEFAITLDNQSKTSWELSPDSITLPLIDYPKLAQQLKRNKKINRGVLIGGTTVSASIFATSCIIVAINPAITAIGGFLVLVGASVAFTCMEITLAIGVSLGMYNHLAYRSNTDLLASQSLSELLILYPQNYVSRSIFVKNKKYKETWEIRLINADDKKEELTFNLCLPMKKA